MEGGGGSYTDLCGLEASAMWMYRCSARALVGSIASAWLISSSAAVAVSFSILSACRESTPRDMRMHHALHTVQAHLPHTENNPVIVELPI